MDGALPSSPRLRHAFPTAPTWQSVSGVSRCDPWTFNQSMDGGVPCAPSLHHNLVASSTWQVDQPTVHGGGAHAFAQGWISPLVLMCTGIRCLLELTAVRQALPEDGGSLGCL